MLAVADPRFRVQVFEIEDTDSIPLREREDPGKVAHSIGATRRSVALPDC